MTVIVVVDEITSPVEITSDTQVIEVSDFAFMGNSFTGLDDTPSGYNTHGNKFLRVKSTEDGIEFTSASGVGDITGPASATDDNIATFDGITGKIIQDGGSTVASVLSRTNHTGTQAASTISDFDTEVSNNTDVAANTSARHTHSNSAILNATTASFTTTYETKLGTIESGAEVNVNSDWNASSGVTQILNKPTLGAVATSNDYDDLDNKPTIAYTSTIDIGDLDNVNTTGATSGKILKYDGANWVVADDEGNIYTDSDWDHNELTNYNIAEHRIINDSSTASTVLWSANKINTELGDKAEATDLTTHTGDASIHFAQGSISITESQISDFGTYLTTISGLNVSLLTNDVGYLTTVSEAAVTAHEAALSITESQISDFGTYLTTIAGLNNSTLTNDSGFITELADDTTPSLSGNLAGGANDISVNSGSKFIFNGSGGNSYLIYNTTTSKVELYVNGVIKAAWG